MKKPEFVEGEIYHIYNRGVEKRNIFLDKHNYLRFLHILFDFNRSEPVLNVNHFFNSKSMEVQPQYLEQLEKRKAKRIPRKLLVEILEFVLMPNHFHLILKQKENGGIIKFMQKLGTGYTMYFNQKNNRVGPLFQGRFKAALVDKDSYLNYLSFYIHGNPVKDKNKMSLSEKIKFLENYRWSSYPDYIGMKNFPSLSSREFLSDYFGAPNKYKSTMIEWMRDFKNDDENAEVLNPRF